MIRYHTVGVSIPRWIANLAVMASYRNISATVLMYPNEILQ